MWYIYSHVVVCLYCTDESHCIVNEMCGLNNYLVGVREKNLVSIIVGCLPKLFISFTNLQHNVITKLAA